MVGGRAFEAKRERVGDERRVEMPPYDSSIFGRNPDTDPLENVLPATLKYYYTLFGSVSPLSFVATMMSRSPSSLSLLIIFVLVVHRRAAVSWLLTAAVASLFRLLVAGFTRHFRRWLSAAGRSVGHFVATLCRCTP
jgi:hypothetical protein